MTTSISELKYALAGVWSLPSITVKLKIFCGNIYIKKVFLSFRKLGKLLDKLWKLNVKNKPWKNENIRHFESWSSKSFKGSRK